jgi:hypothetical protein
MAIIPKHREVMGEGDGGGGGGDGGDKGLKTCLQTRHAFVRYRLIHIQFVYRDFSVYTFLKGG